MQINFAWMQRLIPVKIPQICLDELFAKFLAWIFLTKFWCKIKRLKGLLNFIRVFIKIMKNIILSIVIKSLT